MAINGKNDSDLLRDLLLKGRKYQIAKRQTIQSTDDRQVVNLLTKGFVRRYEISGDGSLGVQIIYGPGSVFPLTLVYRTLFNQALYSGPETFFYESINNVTINSIDVKDFILAVKEDPKLYSDLFQEAGRHLESCIQSLENLALKTADRRVAHLLLYLAKKFGSQQKLGTKIDIPLTQQDIGDTLSLTRETVSTSISELKQKGLIISTSFSKHITVPDLTKLQAAAYK